MYAFLYNIPPPQHVSAPAGKCLHTSGLGAQGTARAEKGFAGWQQQQPQQRHSAASLQQAGRTRLNPAGSGMSSETHWPGIWDVRLTLLNDSLATMSIRATPSSLFDIKAKESGGGVNRWRDKEKKGWRKKGKIHSSSLNPSNTVENVGAESEWVDQLEQSTSAAHTNHITGLWFEQRSYTDEQGKLVVLLKSFHCECVQVYHWKAWWCCKTALRSVYLF